MSKRKTILYIFVVFIALLAIASASYYLYKKNSGPKPLTKEQIEEMQRKELMSYPVDLTTQKSEAEQRKDLELFGSSTSKTELTEEEMRRALTSEEVGQ